MIEERQRRPRHKTRPTPRAEMLAAGARFRHVREREKVTLRKLSFYLRCNMNLIRWHEAGSTMMRLDRMMDAAKVFGVDVKELIP